MNSSMKYTINNSTLKINNGNQIDVEFPSEIGQVEDFNEVFVIRLKVLGPQTMNENVFGVSKKGKILWQIPKIPHVYKSSSYVDISKDNDLCVTHNWDGEIVWLDPKTGEIIKRMEGK